MEWYLLGLEHKLSGQLKFILIPRIQRIQRMKFMIQIERHITFDALAMPFLRNLHMLQYIIIKLVELTKCQWQIE